MRQSGRLTAQQKESHGALGIFGGKAQVHDALVRIAAESVMNNLQGKYPQLPFGHRQGTGRRGLLVWRVSQAVMSW
ncbi:MAG: hypothetical protein IJS28_12050 [Synergistaceae bacterium]|nr:hypothetical protein [Synergistaceae bacterium]